MFRNVFRFNAGEGLTKEQKRAARIRTIGSLIVVIGVVSLASVLITIAVRQDNGQERSQNTYQTVKDLQKGVDLIISCNTPQGKCYKDAAAGRRARTDEIEQTIIATGVCRQQGNDRTFKLLEACVMKMLNS